MASGFQNLNVLDDSLSVDLMNAGRFCFNCEQIFSSRKCLEEHLCSVPSYICSCGTEFTSYNDMQLHSSSHEPGHQVLCHETIKMRRIEKHWEEEEKLKRLQSGEVIWESPKSLPVRVSTQKPPILPKMPQSQAQPHLLPQLSSDLSKNASTSERRKIFADVGSPTVDLWTLFQPVVVVKTMRSFSRTHSYICGKCGQSFTTRKSLVIHYNTHIADKVSGCIGCGLLLSSRKIVPRFHSCNSPLGYKFKLITARPVNQITANLANSLAKAASSSPTQSALNNGSYNKIKIIRDVDHRPNPSKQPFKPVQAKPVIAKARALRVNNPPATQTAPAGVSHTPGKGYECRVCHVYFESINVLQRHKCAKAHEFLMKHKLTASANRQRQVVPLQVPSSSVQKTVTPVLSASTGNTDIKSKLSLVNNKDTTTVVSDDDCFIVESGPEKPAEVIYQVTSSVPIKT